MVLDANDPPVLVSAQYFSFLSQTVFNNTPPGTIVYNVTSFDQDPNDTGSFRTRNLVQFRFTRPAESFQ